jgi:hypothetical protein
MDCWIDRLTIEWLNCPLHRWIDDWIIGLMDRLLDRWIDPLCGCDLPCSDWTMTEELTN